MLHGKYINIPDDSSIPPCSDLDLFERIWVFVTSARGGGRFINSRWGVASYDGKCGSPAVMDSLDAETCIAICNK